MLERTARRLLERETLDEGELRKLITSPVGSAEPEGRIAVEVQRAQRTVPPQRKA
jgi:hypothetical protein